MTNGQQIKNVSTFQHSEPIIQPNYQGNNEFAPRPRTYAEHLFNHNIHFDEQWNRPSNEDLLLSWCSIHQFRLVSTTLTVHQSILVFVAISQYRLFDIEESREKLKDKPHSIELKSCKENFECKNAIDCCIEPHHLLSPNIDWGRESHGSPNPATVMDLHGPMYFVMKPFCYVMH